MSEHSVKFFGQRADVTQIEQAKIGSGCGLARDVEKFLGEIDAEHTQPAVLEKFRLLPEPHPASSRRAPFGKSDANLAVHSRHQVSPS